MTRCPWTGLEFEPVKRGAHEKLFATDAARAEAHKAARQFTEHLIENGFMSWASLRAWYLGQQNPATPSNTTPRKRRTAQMALPLQTERERAE